MTNTLVSTPIDSPLIGVARIPGDKSIGHRALMFSALSSSRVRIRGLSDGHDNLATRRGLMAMGVSIEEDPTGALWVEGAGLGGFCKPDGPIDCGNSGTTMRLFCGLLAGQDFDVELVGDESLSRRPMNRVLGPLREMGLTISGQPGAKEDENYPPLRIGASGSLRGIFYKQKVASAQVKSAILLAGLGAQGTTEVVEPGPSRDHTERMLGAMGAPLQVDGNTIRLQGGLENDALSIDAFDVPGDPSSAAFVVVAALLAKCERVSVEEVCCNERRTGFLDVIGKMRARVELECKELRGGEALSNLVVTHGASEGLRGVSVSGALSLRAIDEIPVLAVLAGRAKGQTRFEDIGELRVKESDRIAATAKLLRALGVGVEEGPDFLVVAGNGGQSFESCEIDADGDHRLAMAAAVAGLVANGPVRVSGAQTVASSFPGFVDTMNSLGASMQNEI